jgi:hypothetical protein
MPPPALAKVDPSALPLVCLSHGSAQAFCGGRHRDQMDMVGQQTIAPNLDVASGAPLGHQFEVKSVIIVAEESRESAIAPLRDMVRHTGNHDTSRSSHEGKISACSLQSRDKYDVPGTPEYAAEAKPLQEEYQKILCP